MAKPTEEDFLKLDVRYLHKTGALTHGKSITFTWTHQKRDGVSEKRKSAEIRAVALAGEGAGREDVASSLRLAYAVSGKPVGHRVVIEWQGLAFKTKEGKPATRPWFRCPGCGSRIACLFFPFRFHVTTETLWLCRSCWGLCYATQNLAPEWRLQRRVFKAFDAIGYEGSILRYPEMAKHGEPLAHSMSWGRYFKKWLAGFHLWLEYNQAVGAAFEKKFPPRGLSEEDYVKIQKLRAESAKRPPGRPRKPREVLLTGALCGATTRAGKPCQCKPEEGKRRCRFHGGKSTGPRTEVGREAIRESNQRRSIDAGAQELQQGGTLCP